MTIEGIIPPIVTPMKADESLDLPRLRQLIDRVIAAGVHGVFVLGTTGEFYALSDEEKLRVVVTAVEHTNRRVPVYAGTGAESTAEAIRVTRMAEKEGADGVSVITPYYIKPSQAEMAVHFRRIAESTSLPVILYSNPATCGGLKLEATTVAKLAELPNVVGIKDSAGDLQEFIEMIRLTPDNFAVLQGRDTLICAGLMFGAKGAVPTTANLAPSHYVAMYESFRAGDVVKAQAIQSRLSPIRLGLTVGTGPGVLKSMMALVDFPCGPARSPITPLSEETLNRLRDVLASAGVSETDF